MKEIGFHGIGKTVRRVKPYSLNTIQDPAALDECGAELKQVRASPPEIVQFPH
jgi:hypothetical protein